jgi:hypothetical protein
LDSEFGLLQLADQTPTIRYGLIGRFFASLKFERREKLDQLGFEPGTFDLKEAKYRFEAKT